MLETYLTIELLQTQRLGCLVYNILWRHFVVVSKLAYAWRSGEHVRNRLGAVTQ